MVLSERRERLYRFQNYPTLLIFYYTKTNVPSILFPQYKNHIPSHRSVLLPFRSLVLWKGLMETIYVRF